MKKIFMTLATARMTLTIILCCVMTTAMFTACSSDDDSTEGVDSRIVGNWYSNVSGKTYAKWNYGETWQTTEFKTDGTGYTHIYYTHEGKAIGCEKIDFTYTASSDGKLTMTPSDRDVMTANWQIVGGELRINGGNNLELTYQKTTGDMTAKFDNWNNTKDLIDVPQPAKYTVFVYGNAGGTMDIAIEEGFWEKAKEFLTDHNNVRVVCFYKYGKDLPEKGRNFSGKYAAPGDIVWYELNSETDLNKIKEEGMQAMGLGSQAIALKICDPNALKMFMEFSSLVCPAKEYVFGVWGHGSGLNPMTDVPGKYSLDDETTRGVMYDEWNNNEELDMYELHDAIKASGIDRLNTLFFHNCMMGNLETLTEVKDCADYICCSAHILSSNGEVMTEFVHGLVDKGNAEDAVAQMFERITPIWQNGYNEDGNYANGDYKLYRTDMFNGILDAAKHLANRLVALYPTQKEAIDRATSMAYRVVPMEGAEFETPFFDIADYAHLLAKETGDAEMKAIATEMDNAFKKAIVHYRDVNWCKEHLEHYTLSVCLVHQLYYTYNYKSIIPSYLCNFDEGYEQCGFHKYTGWGNWLRMNQQPLTHNPQSTGGGLLE